MSGRIEEMQAVWKKLTLAGVWIISIGSAFLLPLPEWGYGVEQQSYTKFILFIVTVIAGFMLLLTKRIKSKPSWLWLSIITFVLFIGAFFNYSFLRENLTLPYNGHQEIIGEVKVPDYDRRMNSLEKTLGHTIKSDELLKYGGGKPNLFFTEKSISESRKMLIVMLALAHIITVIFVMSFLNMLLIYLKNEI